MTAPNHNRRIPYVRYSITKANSWPCKHLKREHLAKRITTTIPRFKTILGGSQSVAILSDPIKTRQIPKHIYGELISNQSGCINIRCSFRIKSCSPLSTQKIQALFQVSKRASNSHLGRLPRGD